MRFSRVVISEKRLTIPSTNAVCCWRSWGGIGWSRRTHWAADVLMMKADFVRLEIASALRRDIPVVPVLVRGAKMPRAEQLPADLRELAYRNAVELTHARWKSDVQVLIQALRPYMKASGEEVSPPARLVRRHPPGSRSGPEGCCRSQAAANSIGIEKAVLERVSRELAAYIGPIAEIVVKRAAKRCTSVTDLCAMVAQEIESSADRAKFLASCRR